MKRKVLLKIRRIPSRILLVMTVMALVSCTTAIKHYKPIDGPMDERISIDIAEALNTRDDLDFGIYFFAADGSSQRMVPGKPIQNFDPKKPTVIYLHGWERDTTVRDFRESYLVEDIKGFKGQLTHTSWLSKGWNAAVFYWNQFADEPEVKHAEAKIWTYLSPHKLRYRVKSGAFVASEARFTIAELFTVYYEYLFSKRPEGAGEIRLVGHSLGHQLALKSAELIAQRSQLKFPDRIALLDPFWSKGKKAYLDQQRPKINQATAAIAEDIVSKHDLALELYRSSFLGAWFFLGDPNIPLMTTAASLRWYPEFTSAFDFKTQHVGVIPYYFTSYGQKENDGISAATPTAKIKKLMNRPEIYLQKRGLDTTSAADDKFKVIPLSEF